MQKYTTIVWDMDGTLMDTLQDLYEAVNHALVSNGMPERTFEEVRQFVGNGVRRLMALSVPEGEANPAFEQAFSDFKSYYMVHCQDHTGLYAGIAETLSALREKGIRMAVVSNKLQAGIDELYKVWFKDTIEVAIGERPEMARKPAPDMVYKALEDLGVDKQGAVYIGDSDVDLATAHNAGLPCISVLWGFRDRNFLEKHGATTFVQSPLEILNFV